ncbi:GW domain-containing glycosaminoglycan-binding protein [Listeria monocytogenes]|uniref:GW domain-containing glycosaminoglycan-binding protein n=1 Tax=Listeria monocytogenes TaxID=1639 RepID=UPI00098E1DDC|nr:GW domain-containing glycosaminoglycan-binding protein [Listeria monocytogenes]EAC8463532.1 GW domain-containing glycosaminoglycan-binding protein [Listeria monocytogenes]EAD7601290.1 GW domain-containing glycosaminoglycan-binding protein [Listeria monocytogenes]EAF8226435.1 GW domain-containing glycosaminoglycan-binding protein [Listeria monocytogenes]EAK8940390.1 GW domain-containing glycosaminoglycan-binding protein [Listeria monocytogenes]EHP6530702.1 GW domain-containing glycosaminogly
MDRKCQLIMKKKFTQILLASVIVGSTLVPFVQAEAAGTNQTVVSQAGMTLSQQQFIQSIANDAQELQKEEKILTSVTLAQAILESNWGKSGLSTSANNLFGIKGSYEGSSVSMRTREFSSGKAYYTQADFRKYPDKKASLVDHAQLFINGVSGNANLYSAVIGETDYKKAAYAIQNAGYATDPAYAEKLISTIENYHLDQYDQIYDTVKTTENQLAYAEIKNTSNETIWTKPYNTEGAEKAAIANDYKNKTLRISQKAVTEKGTWYQLQDQGKTIGWISSNAVEIFYTPQNETKVTLDKYITDSDQKVYAYPVEDNSKVVANLNDYLGKELDIDRRADVKNEYWYRIKSEDGKVIGWSKAGGFAENNPNKALEVK